MLCRKPSETPMESNLWFDLDSGDTLVDKGRYQILIGRPIYLSHKRSDVGFVVSVVSQHMHNPPKRHLKVVN